MKIIHFIMELVARDNIRRNKSGLPAAVDVVLALSGVKNGRQTWNALKKKHPETLDHIETEMMRGGAVDFLRATGFKFVIANLSSNKKHGAEKLTALKMAALNLQEKFFLDAPGLANDCIDRIEDDNALEHIAQRALTKTSSCVLQCTKLEAVAQLCIPL